MSLELSQAWKYLFQSRLFSLGFYQSSSKNCLELLDILFNFYSLYTNFSFDLLQQGNFPLNSRQARLQTASEQLTGFLRKQSKERRTYPLASIEKVLRVTCRERTLSSQSLWRIYMMEQRMNLIVGQLCLIFDRYLSMFSSFLYSLITIMKFQLDSTLQTLVHSCDFISPYSYFFRDLWSSSINWICLSTPSRLCWIRIGSRKSP